MQKSTVVALILILVSIGVVFLINFLFPESVSLLQTTYDFIIAGVIAVIAFIVMKNYRSTGLFAITCGACCYFIGYSYILLHFLLRGFPTQSDFSISDISFIGAYLFNAAFALYLFFSIKSSHKMNRKAVVLSVLGISCFTGILLFGLLAGYFLPVPTITYGIAALITLTFCCMAFIRIPRKKPFVFFLLLQTGNILILVTYFILYGVNIPLTSIIFVLVQLAQTCLAILTIPVMIAFSSEAKRTRTRTTEQLEVN